MFSTPLVPQVFQKCTVKDVGAKCLAEPRVRDQWAGGTMPPGEKKVTEASRGIVVGFRRPIST